MKIINHVLVILSVALLCGCRTNREVVTEQAVNGNPYFQGVLAENYLTGMMYKINYDLAAKWARESAEKHDAVGLYTLGIICEYGLGSTPVDPEKARELYAAARPGLEKLAGENTLQAMHDLGTMYLYGRGGEKNYGKAFALLNAAAIRDYAPAMADLAGMYMNGYGVNRNAEAARKLLLRAAMAGLPEAQVGIAGIYFEQQKYVPALNWYKEAAAKNSPAAMTAMAAMCRDGVGTEKNPYLSEGYLNQAAQMSYPPAMTELARMYLNDKTPASNPEAGMKWCNSAIAKDYAPAAIVLADHYFKQAKNSPQAAVKAMILYQLAANNGLASPNVVELDALTGLYYFIRWSWDAYPRVSAWLEHDSAMKRIITGFQSGIIQPESDAFRKAVAEQPENYFRRNDWYLIHSLKMPISWSAEILAAVPEKERSTPFYWLCYGTCANLAGRPELAMSAVKHLLDSAMKESSAARAAEIKDLAVIIRTSALVQRGMDDKAYKLLAVSGKFTADPRHLWNYLNHYAQPAIKDPARFTGATGLWPESAPSKKPLPLPRPFLDCGSGKIVGNEVLIPEPTVKPSEFDK